MNKMLCSFTRKYRQHRHILQYKMNFESMPSELLRTKNHMTYELIYLKCPEYIEYRLAVAKGMMANEQNMTD